MGGVAAILPCCWPTTPAATPGIEGDGVVKAEVKKVGLPCNR